MKASGPGLVCLECGSATTVTDSRGGEKYIRRRRQCLADASHARFTTVEAAGGGYGIKVENTQAGRAMALLAQLDSLPLDRREIVTKLIAVFSEEKQG